MFVVKMRDVFIMILNIYLENFQSFYGLLLTLIPKFGRYACIYYGSHSRRMDAMFYQA
jgi:hypothetical protein